MMESKQIERTVNTAQHAEPQHVDLKQIERRQVVLVPLNEGALFHGGVADGHNLGQWPSRENKAANMLGEMAGKTDQLVGQLEHRRQERIGRGEPGLAHMLLRQWAS